jgi:flagella basal body P-ring formation protein FlgA
MFGREFLAVAIFFALMAASAQADGVTTTRIIKAQDIIEAADVTVITGEVEGAILTPADVVGMEAKTTLYAGRAIRPEDIGRPAAVDRNETVEMIYREGPLTIVASGRALDRAAVGETIRVMNSTSRVTVSAYVTAPGQVTILSN